LSRFELSPMMGYVQDSKPKAGTSLVDSFFFTLLIIGVFSSFIGTLAGGGGLITLPAMLILGIPIQTGIATNKFSSGIAAFTSVTYLLKNKQLDATTIFINMVIAFLGGISGALITTSLSEKTMNVVALILLAFALIVTFKNNNWISAAIDVKDSNKASGLASRIITFFIAVYDGGFGPGSSTFGIIHYMTKKQTYVKAVQLTRVLIFGSAFGAFIVFYLTGFVQWPYAIALAIGSTLGSQIGLVALPHIPLKLAKSLLVTILVLLIGEMVYKIL
jgi:uncharacterized protein